MSLVSRDAAAAGAFKLKSTTVTEVSGAWHLFVTIELPRAPATAHVPIKFLFTKETVFERALIDGHNDPVINRTPLQNQTPAVESLDVDFADGSGKIFKGTRFDFGLTRTRGYEAGEYKVTVRTADGLDIGGAQRLTLNGDNPVVDRRSITFNAQSKSIKKVEDGVDAGPKVAQNDDVAPVQSQDVTASGTAAPFIPAEAYQKQPEEELKEHPKGCGCETVGKSGSAGFGLLGLAALGAVLALRRRRAR
jgi:MYXO-CTERM domain-containing protein